MARLAWVLLVVLGPAAGQVREDKQLEEAGVCARCHVISVVEWGISKHEGAGVNCVSCHGGSRGHVADERNNIKPDKRPRGADIRALCANCHQSGCPRTEKNADCQACHHVHALLDPKKPPAGTDEAAEQLKAKWKSAERYVAEGERLMKSEQWERARTELKAALAEKPNEPRATALLRVCGRRLTASLAGFETTGLGRDAATGLPSDVIVSGTAIAMALIPGGDAEIGSAAFPASQPIHTVHVDPIYLGKLEITQAQWRALMGSNPSAHQGKGYPDADRMPVENVSWDDARAFIERLNERIPGGRFRLPTEVEWERAARAGTTRAVSLTQIAWFDGPQRAGSPRRAGTKMPNALGLFDLYGNVWEWCSSLYLPYPYDALDGRESSSASGLRVLRGGGYADSATYLDAGARHGERPYRRLPWNGFRIARDVPED